MHTLSLHDALPILKSKQIDEIAETHLLETINLEIDFEVEDALDKLESIKLIHKENNFWFPSSINDSINELNEGLTTARASVSAKH